jgi:hypothetical protein
LFDPEFELPEDDPEFEPPELLLFDPEFEPPELFEFDPEFEPPELPLFEFELPEDPDPLPWLLFEFPLFPELFEPVLLCTLLQELELPTLLTEALSQVLLFEFDPVFVPPEIGM